MVVFFLFIIICGILHLTNWKKNLSIFGNKNHFPEISLFLSSIHPLKSPPSSHLCHYFNILLTNNEEQNSESRKVSQSENRMNREWNEENDKGSAYFMYMASRFHMVCRMGETRSINEIWYITAIANFSFDFYLSPCATFSGNVH